MWNGVEFEIIRCCVGFRLLLSCTILIRERRECYLTTNCPTSDYSSSTVYSLSRAGNLNSQHSSEIHEWGRRRWTKIITAEKLLFVSTSSSITSLQKKAQERSLKSKSPPRKSNKAWSHCWIIVSVSKIWKFSSRSFFKNDEFSEKWYPSIWLIFFFTWFDFH